MLTSLASLGIGTSVFHRAVVARAQESDGLTPERVAEAEWIAGVELTEEEREQVAQSLQRSQGRRAELRDLKLTSDVAPAFLFQPLGATAQTSVDHERAPRVIGMAGIQKPADSQALAFMSVSQLSELLRRRQVTSLELTQLYLERLKKYDPLLKCVVTLTEDLAVKQAKKADQEIAAGQYRGPLHGIPWGAKDLIAYPGYPTTWGAPQFREQQFDTMATVAQRLEEAGAVLVAKLSLGALAMGDQWFGGMTRNPWDVRQGSSGSSAGSASATAAGLVGFALGSETLGSIVSPSRRCGTSALRPTFGRVSRAGCMPLSWTMDKIGPIARSMQDCALIFAAIQGADGIDRTVVDRDFEWPVGVDVSTLRVGYTVRRRRGDEAEPTLPPVAALLKEMGATVEVIELPNDLPVRAMTSVLDVESASMFEELTNAHETEGLNVWPGIFRAARFMSAVEYVQAMRARSLLMEKMEQLFENIDVYISDTDLPITNLTGHPSIVIPTGFRDRDGRQVSTTAVLTGRLYEESSLLALGHQLQQKMDAHLQRPPLDEQLRDMESQQSEENSEAGN
jgi:Asp-tRNA(Asn)/Glu-tRNA(Gln) amidotransferase A subunit family amidase